MKSKLKKITYLIIGLLIAFLPNNTLIFNNEAQTELSIPKQSAVDCDPIFIDDSDPDYSWSKTAAENDWCSGSGTWNDPYIIENLKIDGLEVMDGIKIYNSDVSFIIQDCLIYNSSSGIYLDNVNNSRLINNNCSNMGAGLYLDYYCNNNTISGNTANGNTNEGILLIDGDYNYITGNTVNDNNDGIRIDPSCDNNFIGGNTANDNNRYGISLEESDYNNITGNTANNNTLHGIYLYDNCDFNNIINNIANNNTDQGIYLETDCDNNNITDNTINGNTGHGIYLDYNCDFNNIINNTANDNTGHGIFLSNSDYSNITDNTINGNTGHGIYLLIFDYSNITGNTINDNTDTGIYIDSTSDKNSIYKNFFLENGKHAEDDGTDNKWNSTTIGNYWDNWTSPDVSPNDGIVDDPYTYIGGSAGSIDYLPIAEDGAPVIVINSPASSDVFGVTAPSFDVTITDVYVDSMWYTIDGGIYNYTFIENGVINQTAWAALTEGDVTITFYAKDNLGNEASEAVTVVKRIPATGLDPGIIITIVVVSVAGGVALAAVIYIYFKKRPSPE